MLFEMLNAVLVFNNNGQPRLTKFYTQLVSIPSLDHLIGCEMHQTHRPLGHGCPATSDLGNLHARLCPPEQRMQLSPSSAPPRTRLGKQRVLHRAQ